MRRVLMLGSLLIIVVAAGCASRPALRTESSTSAIRAAEEVGASGVPRASYHLQLAKEELDRARVLSDKGKKDEAASQLLRAEADAELAVVLSREQGEKLEAAQAMERVRQLRSDNQ
jgi:Spy/CpxP family protein refolding chaperone